MYNYPNFLNLLTTFFYIPLSFGYIFPVAKFGWLGGTISQEQMDLPKKTFAVMGFLDCLAGIMQIFAATYLPGPLLILISQMAIPISMVLSKTMLGAKYKPYQYVGAIIVFFGIVTVLAPQFNGSSTETCQAIIEPGYNDTLDKDCAVCDDISLTTKAKCTANDVCEWSVSSSGGESDSSSTLIWAAVMVLSCIPMTLSSIYKEIALGETELDPIFLNGWIAVFQFLFSIPLAIPAAMASDPPIYPADLWTNMKGGMQCYLGSGTIDAACGIHGDEKCDEYR